VLSCSLELDIQRVVTLRHTVVKPAEAAVEVNTKVLSTVLRELLIKSNCSLLSICVSIKTIVNRTFI
jgi:hypothetical protein